MINETSIQTIPTMLRFDGDGVLRVGRSRVTFDLVIYAYEEGETPEGIAERYPSLELPAVYGAINWYLLHREEAAQYLQEREELGRRAVAEVERKFPTNGLRERLLARWEARKRDLPAE